MVTKIISGAQTGADQAGLAAAIDLGLLTGGWIPKGRRTAKGQLPYELFQLWRLQEHSSPSYPPRTEMNIMESDGTIIFGDVKSPGSELTVRLCQKHRKPCIGNPMSHADMLEWLRRKKISTLNIAGNREEINPGIFSLTYEFVGTSLASDTFVSKLDHWREVLKLAA